MTREVRQSWILLWLVALLIGLLGLGVWQHAAAVVAALVGHHVLVGVLEDRDRARRRQLATWNRRALP